MATFTLVLWCCLLLGTSLNSAAPVRGSVFLSSQAANTVLQRHKRYNSGFLEEFREGDLERECLEEKCDLEEAREIFEDDEKTMEFWSVYVDGNQCESSPCVNQGSCKDHIGYYTCLCETGFTGRNCEIVVTRRCDVNNGDCMHFCMSVGTLGAKCSCALGYRLQENGRNCEPEDEFPCGRTALMEMIKLVKRSLFSPGKNISALTTASPSSTSLDNKSATDVPPVPEFNRTLTTRIVGGHLVSEGEIPWQVALISHPGGHFFCGGSILSSRWVITAAHCLVETNGPFIIRVGEYNLFITEGPEQDHEVLEQHIHPRYNSSLSLYNHDIALLYLKTSISFSSTARPICVGPRVFTEALVKRASPSTVSGWGRTRFLGSMSGALQQVDVPYVDRAQCKESSSARITRFMFCAGYHSQAKDACQGDSGGPHATYHQDTWFLTGIVSWGEECAKEGKYGVYTRVSLYYSWINYVIGSTKDRLQSDIDDFDNVTDSSQIL